MADDIVDRLQDRAEQSGDDVLSSLLNDAATEITLLQSRLDTAAAVIAGFKLPCDVKLPPVTTIKAGCEMTTVHVGLAARARSMARKG